MSNHFLASSLSRINPNDKYIKVLKAILLLHYKARTQHGPPLSIILQIKNLQFVYDFLQFKVKGKFFFLNFVLKENLPFFFFSPKPALHLRRGEDLLLREFE